MADTQVKTQDPEEEVVHIVADMKARPLSVTESAEVEKTFTEAKDFLSERRLQHRLTLSSQKQLLSSTLIQS